MIPAELTVIEKKYASKRICELSKSEILTKAIETISRIHVITGWTIPDNKDYIKILAEEFNAKLVEDFGQMNFDEVTHAFRRSGVAVKDWGKSMNLQLIFDVLDGYMQERKEISEKEERIKTQPVQKIYTADELDNIHRGDVEAFYQRCLKGVIPPTELPAYYLTILIKDGYMAEGSDDLHGFFAYWINQGYKNIYLPSS